MNDTRSHLAPCPFCGGAARSLKNGYTQCLSEACTPYQSPEHWNRRAPDPVRDELLAALLQCREYLKHSLGSTSEINPYPAMEAALSKATS